MAIRLPDGSIQMSDGRILYANSVILAADLIEVLPLLIPPPTWPFMGGGGNGQSFINNNSPSAGGGGGGGTGANGAQGVQGPQGTNPGVQGPQGNQGVAGTGAQGAQGLRGFQGFQGTQGPQGNQGNLGPQGNIGTGTQGFQGLQGSSSGGGGLFENNQSNTVGTTDATPTVVVSETIPALSVATFRAVVDARYNDGSQHASFVKTIRVHREGAGAVLGIENADYTDDSSFALTATFTVSGNDIQMTVIGVAATNITWKVRMGRVILP